MIRKKGLTALGALAVAGCVGIMAPSVQASEAVPVTADAGGCGVGGQLRRIQQCAVLLYDLWLGLFAQDIGLLLSMIA